MHISKETSKTANKTVSGTISSSNRNSVTGVRLRFNPAEQRRIRGELEMIKSLKRMNDTSFNTSKSIIQDIPKSLTVKVDSYSKKYIYPSIKKEGKLLSVDIHINVIISTKTESY